MAVPDREKTDAALKFACPRPRNALAIAETLVRPRDRRTAAADFGHETRVFPIHEDTRREGVGIVFGDFQSKPRPRLTSLRGDWAAGRQIAGPGNDGSISPRRQPPWKISRTASPTLRAHAAWKQVFLMRPLYTIAWSENGRGSQRGESLEVSNRSSRDPTRGRLSIAAAESVSVPEWHWEWAQEC